MKIGKYDLVGGGICPEQYDVYLDGGNVGYLRLRHGIFTAETPFGGTVVYRAGPDGDGEFEDYERMRYLKAAVKAIDRHLKTYPNENHQTRPRHRTNPIHFLLRLMIENTPLEEIRLAKLNAIRTMNTDIFSHASDWLCECGQRANPVSESWRWDGQAWEHHHGYPIGHVVAAYKPIRPPIVCLCGSGRFKEAFEAAEYRETLAGRIVLTIGCNAHDVERSEELKQHKPMLDELHLRKIDLADEILVLNVGGYIGPSTRREIIYATKAGKPVRLLEPNVLPECKAALDAEFKETSHGIASK